MESREFRVMVVLPGNAEMQLCSCTTANMAAEVIRVLCDADKPAFTRVIVEIGLDLTPAR